MVNVGKYTRHGCYGICMPFYFVGVSGARDGLKNCCKTGNLSTGFLAPEENLLDKMSLFPLLGCLHLEFEWIWLKVKILSVCYISPTSHQPVTNENQRCFPEPKKKLQPKQTQLIWLVFTHLKNISQNGNLPQVGVNKKIWNHHLVIFVHPFSFAASVTLFLIEGEWAS